MNVTMLLLAGEHVLSENHTECVAVSMFGSFGDYRYYYGHVISNLQTFEMIGLKQAACNYVVVQLSTNLNITKHRFANFNLNSSLGNY